MPMFLIFLCICFPQVNRQNDNQVLAIKCVDLRNVDDQIRAGYLNEITMLQRMQGSPLVVNLIDYELCEARQMLFVVMEKGACDLASFIKDVSRRRDMKLSTILAFWKDMVEAVAAIHERGIIHSDLKPANFLVVGEVGFHQLKLIDFGIASSVQSDMTSVVRESPAGTLNYMSPEAVQGMHGQQSRVKINYKSDIWSLGCILYNLLYGRTPFQQVTHPTLKADAICNPRHVIEFPARSPTLPGDGCVSSPLLQTVQACLTRDPSARPTAKQLLAIKYCGCNEMAMQSLEPLIYGLLSVIRSHPLGREFSTRIIAALQEDVKHDRPGGH
ncbi:hypothetical protein B566_EDAN017089 [Ephemera danica]|nr:hypothetical protein B566_EDAN017089 [Ephemera danica]